MRADGQEEIDHGGPKAAARAGLFQRLLEPRSPMPPAEDAELPKGLRVLIVGDREATRRALGLTLAPICGIVHMAQSGEDALRALERTRFDLVFMDAHMPRMGGVEAVCALRDRELAGDRTPVVAIASSLSDDDREACGLAGMDGFAAMPVEAGALFALVKTVVAANRAELDAASADRLGAGDPRTRFS